MFKLSPARWSYQLVADDENWIGSKSAYSSREAAELAGKAHALRLGWTITGTDKRSATGTRTALRAAVEGHGG